MPDATSSGAYRARTTLTLDSARYEIGDVLPVPRRRIEDSGRTQEFRGQRFRVTPAGAPWFEDLEGRRWLVIVPAIGSIEAVLERPPVDLDDLVARGLAWAPGEGPSEDEIAKVVAEHQRRTAERERIGLDGVAALLEVAL